MGGFQSGWVGPLVFGVEQRDMNLFGLSWVNGGREKGAS